MRRRRIRSGLVSRSNSSTGGADVAEYGIPLLRKSCGTVSLLLVGRCLDPASLRESNGLSPGITALPPALQCICPL